MQPEGINMADVKERRKRGGGRAGNAARRGGEIIDQMPWRLVRNTDRPTEPLGPEGVLAIHDGAMRILEEIGIEAERVQMVTMSAGMGTRFARIATEYTEKIRELGPNPVKAGWPAGSSLAAS